MFKKIREFFKVGQYEKQIQEAKEEITKLKTENFVLKQRKELPHPLVEVDMGDPAPFKTEDRKAYVAQVAGFHTDIQKKKTLSLVSDLRGQFETINRETFGYSQRDYDLFLKGTINGLWLVYEWGEGMVNEHLSYQTEQEELSDEEKKSLKAKLN